MWLHPPRNIELSIYDELFVLCEKNENQNIQESQKAKNDVGSSQFGSSGKTMKNEGKKIQTENVKEMNKLNYMLKNLL